jgi:hypothetical protein
MTGETVTSTVRAKKKLLGIHSSYNWILALGREADISWNLSDLLALGLFALLDGTKMYDTSIFEQRGNLW